MADTGTAPEIGEAGTALKSIADSVKAANDIIKGVSDLLPNLTRSIVVEVDNITSKTLTLTGNTQFVTGGFGPTLPQGQILPSKSDVFSFVGKEPVGGVNGMVTYSLQGVGEFSVAADNPVAGTNSVNVFSNPSVDNFVSIIGVHSDGNHNHARFAVIEKAVIEKGTPPLGAAPHSGPFIQSRFGRQGNFELLVPAGSRIIHFFRANDEPGTPWHKFAELPNSANASAVAMIESNIGTPGNFEVVARIGDALSTFFFDGAALRWNGPFGIIADGQPIPGATGTPTLIQSRFGRQGNFELLVPAGSRIMHFFRANDEPGTPWHKFAELPNSGNASAVAMIESNIGTPGNFEVVARIGDALSTFFFDGAALRWKGPFGIIADGQSIPGATGTPALIQSRFGRQGNFELLVPAGSRIIHFFRANDEPGTPWHKFAELPNSANASAVAMIESNIGTPGNFEVVARIGDALSTFFFDGAALRWHGPFGIIADGQPIPGATGF